MNIGTSNIKTQNAQVQKTTTNKQNQDLSVKFVDELKELESNNSAQDVKQVEEQPEEKELEPVVLEEANKKTDKEVDKTNINIAEQEENINNDGLTKSVEELAFVVQKLNQPEEKQNILLKVEENNDDNDNNMINNDINIQDNKDLFPQMSPNMNFSGDGQPFSSFMGNENNQPQKELSATTSELAEEAEILSTMAENIAIANKNTLVQEKVVNREEGIKKVDTKTGIIIENVVKYESIIMNEADVEVFASLADKGEVNLNNLAPEAAQKSVHVSKTLADMLSKAKDSGQPLRIDFDNGISVIIKISRDGKVSADFLPSTQVAEAYLKENLPLLKQRFDEKNLDYDSLNQRERRDQNKEDNRKKGRRDE